MVAIKDDEHPTEPALSAGGRRMNELPVAMDVAFTERTLEVALSDGRTLSVPLVWFPRLFGATAEQRSRWRLVDDGQAIEWDDVGEGVSVEGLLLSS
jgi:Protein of unknown function (DUF2442)